MTARELTRNFATQYRKPFGVDTVRSYTGQSESEIRVAIRDLIREDAIAEISPGIYLRKREIANSSIPAKNNTFCYRAEYARELMGLIGTGRLKSIREVATAWGYSRQFAYLYLEALLSIGVIDVIDRGYVLTGKTDLVALGIRIDKGIIGKRKPKKGFRDRRGGYDRRRAKKQS